jgi:hypothetical protein
MGTSIWKLYIYRPFGRIWCKHIRRVRRRRRRRRRRIRIGCTRQ